MKAIYTLLILLIPFVGFGQCQSTVTKDTNFLVLGEQDFNKFGEGYKSSKIKKAEKLKLKGSDIEIISESQFLELINE